MREDGIYIPLIEQDPPAKAYEQAEVTRKKSRDSCLALPSSWIFGSELLFDGILLVPRQQRKEKKFENVVVRVTRNQQQKGSSLRLPKHLLPDYSSD